MKYFYLSLCLMLIAGCAKDEKMILNEVICGDFEAADCLINSGWEFSDASIVPDPENVSNSVLLIVDYANLTITGLNAGSSYILEYDRKVFPVWDSPDIPIVGWIVSLTPASNGYTADFVYAEFTVSNPDTLWHKVSKQFIATNNFLNINYNTTNVNDTSYIDNVVVTEI